MVVFPGQQDLSVGSLQYAKSIRMERESEEQCPWHGFYVPTVGKDAVPAVCIMQEVVYGINCIEPITAKRDILIEKATYVCPMWGYFGN